MARTWIPHSRQDRPIRQVSDYPDRAGLDAVFGRLKTHPPLERAVKREGGHAGGVHFEMAGQGFTEFPGGAQAINELDLYERCQTARGIHGEWMEYPAPKSYRAARQRSLKERK